MPDPDTAFIMLLAIVVVAGIARGVSGFGTGMIVAPVAAALYDPQTAVVVIVIIDSLPTVPITLPAMKIARWREVLPVAAGLALFVPLGVFILKHGDPWTLRWVISIAILACVAGLWRGWRYRGPRNVPASLAVGGVSGTLSGIASIPGPPVIMYWMASGLPAAIVRANLLTLFLVGEVMSLGNLWAAGLLERERVVLGLWCAPAYLGALLVGWRLYGLSSDATYRRITFLLIVAAAVLALPVTDQMLRAALGSLAG